MSEKVQHKKEEKGPAFVKSEHVNSVASILSHFVHHLYKEFLKQKCIFNIAEKHLEVQATSTLDKRDANVT